MTNKSPAELQHLLLSLVHNMHTHACGFSNSWSSLMYLAPSDFLGLEHLTSSCRSAFAHSCSLSRRFIHGSGWRNGSGIRRRAVEASRTHLKSSRSDPIAPIATLRSACHCLPPPLYSFARGRRRSFNRSNSVGSHRSSSNTSASVVLSQLENICSVQSNLCQCAFARCESALWRREW